MTFRMIGLTAVFSICSTLLAATSRPSCAQEWRGSLDWAAVAVSPLTGQWGWSTAHSSRESAERAARANCGTRDAQVILSTTRPFIAFASGLLGSGAGAGHTREEAQSRALSECRKYAPLGTVKFCRCNGADR